MCEELSPAEPVAKKTKGPDSDEAAPLDKPTAEKEPTSRAPNGGKSDKSKTATSDSVKFILSIPVNDGKTKEIIVQFSSEDVAFAQSDDTFDDMIEFIDDILEKKYGPGVHVDDTSIEIVKRTKKEADGVWKEAVPMAK
jgi:hypothetical protein